MASSRWKSIVPASEALKQQGTPHIRSKPRRSIVQVACVQCRAKKARCNGLRPICSRCEELQLSCQYDVTQGVSRAERFRVQRQRQISITNNLAAVVDALRAGSDLEATNVLARLRLGEPVEAIVQSLSSNNSCPPPGRSNVQAQAATPEIYSPAGSTAALPNLEMSIERLSDRSTASVDLGTFRSSCSAELPVPDRNDQFLSVIFKRKDFLLPTARQDESEEVNKQLVMPTALPTASPAALQRLYGVFDDLGDPKTGFYNRLEPSSCEPQEREVHNDAHAGRNLLATWSSYPNIGNSYAIPSVFDVVRLDSRPHHARKTQVQNLPIPPWGLMSVNTRSDPGSVQSAFTHIYDKATASIRRGISEEEIFGSHPNIAALYSKEEFEGSPVLSRWAASMVHSLKLEGYNFTCFGSMYAFWYLMRWMISPSRLTYEAMPKWLRPTPNQLFIPHIHMLDFVIWPKLREFAVSTPTMQEKMEWLLDLFTHIQCQWPFTTKEALYKDVKTGQTILSNHAKDYVFALSNWSVGPTIRAYIPNADVYLMVRSENG